MEIGNRTVKNQIWESREDAFRKPSNWSAYYKGANVIIIAVDMTEQDALAHLQEQYQLVEEYGHEGVTVVVAATKSDAKEDRKVNTKDLEAVVEELGLDLRYVSSKTGEGVEGLFNAANRNYLSKVNEENVEYKGENPLDPHASSTEMKELITLITQICRNSDHWTPKVRLGCGEPVSNDRKIPEGVLRILTMCQNPPGTDAELLKSIGERAEYKYSPYFQGIHSFFRGRDDETNNFYGILAKLEGENGTKQSVVCKIISDLKQLPMVTQAESTQLMPKYR